MIAPLTREEFTRLADGPPIDQATAEAIGAAVVSFLSISRIRGTDRYRTDWGTKTAAGLARSLVRVIGQSAIGEGV